MQADSRALLYYSIFVLLSFLKPIPLLTCHSLPVWNGCRQLPGKLLGQLCPSKPFQLKSSGSFPHLHNPTANPFRKLSKRRDGFFLTVAPQSSSPSIRKRPEPACKKGKVSACCFWSPKAVGESQCQHQFRNIRKIKFFTLGGSVLSPLIPSNSYFLKLLFKK